MTTRLGSLCILADPAGCARRQQQLVWLAVPHWKQTLTTKCSASISRVRRAGSLDETGGGGLCRTVEYQTPVSQSVALALMVLIVDVAAERARWIGWTARARRENVPRVVNNSRFLIFPHVRVPHLASHVLG
jgi:hypothetical protein